MSKAITAAELCQTFELTAQAKAILKPDDLPKPFLERLIGAKLYTDAVQVTAHALPRREVIWWACVCARKAYGSTPPPKHAAALDAAEAWVSQPTDEKRRAAFKLAEAAEFGNPAGLIGMAVFFSSGSIGPPGQTELAPPPQVCPHAIANAVILSAVLGDAKQAAARYPQFFELAFEVANGKNRWK